MEYTNTEYINIEKLLEFLINQKNNLLKTTNIDNDYHLNPNNLIYGWNILKTILDYDIYTIPEYIILEKNMENIERKKYYYFVEGLNTNENISNMNTLYKEWSNDIDNILNILGYKYLDYLNGIYVCENIQNKLNMKLLSNPNIINRYNLLESKKRKQMKCNGYNKKENFVLDFKNKYVYWKDNDLIYLNFRNKDLIMKSLNVYLKNNNNKIIPSTYFDNISITDHNLKNNTITFNGVKNTPVDLILYMVKLIP